MEKKKKEQQVMWHVKYVSHFCEDKINVIYGLGLKFWVK